MSFGGLVSQLGIETNRRCNGVRKIVVGMLVSLDGVAEAPDRFFGWDDAIDAKTAALIATQDAVILGRRSYDEWVGFWPGSEIEPFASFITGSRSMSRHRRPSTESGPIRG